MQYVYYCCRSQLLQRNFSFFYFEYLINSQQNYCERLPLHSVQPPLRLTGEFEFWNFGFWGKSKHFRFQGRVILSGGYISQRERGEVISFSVHFPILKSKISKIQGNLATPSFSKFTFSDLRWMQGFKQLLTSTLNLNFLVQGAVSFHPSVGNQNQANPWNGFLFYPLSGFRGPSKPSSQ